MARSVWPKVAGGRGPLLARRLRLAGARGASGLAHAGGELLPRPRSGEAFRLYRAAAGDRRARHLRPHPPVQGVGAGRGDGRGRQERDDRLPADPGARRLARRRRPALRPGATSARPSSSSRRSAPIVCRSVDNLYGAQLSEHSFGNAIDVSGFRSPTAARSSSCATGRRPARQEAAFLREVHAGACQHFTTVLGPGADVFHYNHFHLDLAMHGSTSTGPRRYCRPNPPPDLQPPPARPDGLPPAPDLDEPMDVARAAMRPNAGPLDLHGPSAAIPPPVAFEVKPGAAAGAARRRRRRRRADLGDPAVERRLNSAKRLVRSQTSSS